MPTTFDDITNDIPPFDGDPINGLYEWFLLVGAFIVNYVESEIQAKNASNGLKNQENERKAKEFCNQSFAHAKAFAIIINQMILSKEEKPESSKFVSL